MKATEAKKLVAVYDCLIAYGYQPDDAEELANAYVENGIDGAIAYVAGWNDAEHDYSGELKTLLERFNEQAETDMLPRSR